MLTRDRDIHPLAMETMPIDHVLLFGSLTFDEDQELPFTGPRGSEPLWTPPPPA
jgi:hypothetical protein